MYHGRLPQLRAKRDKEKGGRLTSSTINRGEDWKRTDKARKKRGKKKNKIQGMMSNSGCFGVEKRTTYTQ